MSDEVKFDEEVVLVDSASQVTRQSGLTNILIKLGLAKTETQASYILIGILAFCLIATVYVITRYII